MPTISLTKEVKNYLDIAKNGIKNFKNKDVVNMDYVIKLLEKDNELITNCLSKGEWLEYPEAKKRQEKKSKQLKKAIEILKTNGAK